jgi:ribosome maturation factor RimP
MQEKDAPIIKEFGVSTVKIKIGKASAAILNALDLRENICDTFTLPVISPGLLFRYLNVNKLAKWRPLIHVYNVKRNPMIPL